RETRTIEATAELAAGLGIEIGTEVVHVATRASEGGRPISVSDSYQTADIPDITAAVFLEETVTDALPVAAHAEWLRTPAGELVKSVRQRYLGPGDEVLMLSDVSYP